MKKIAKITMIVFMLLGIGFSILNLIAVELKAGCPRDGSWVFNGPDKECMAPGDVCFTG
jgi:hypothetical protein